MGEFASKQVADQEFGIVDFGDREKRADGRGNDVECGLVHGAHFQNFVREG
jgi:hypothetical protein